MNSRLQRAVKRLKQIHLISEKEAWQMLGQRSGRKKHLRAEEKRQATQPLLPVA